MIVKESLSFERTSSTFSSLNIGMKNMIQKFMEDLKSEFPESRWEWKINDDLSIDIIFRNSRGYMGTFDISLQEYSTLPSYIKFNIIEGDFANCFRTKESLKSFPYKIIGKCDFFGHGNYEFTEKDIKNICKVELSINFH